MMRSTINPHCLTANIDSLSASPVINEKIYVGCVQGLHQQWNCHREFKRADDAYKYALRVLSRWIRLFDAAERTR